MIPEKIRVEIWSDITCVHCYMAKRQFEKALDAFEHREQVEITWRSFELAHDLIVEKGQNMYQFLANYNRTTIDQVIQVCDQIANEARKMGLTYDFKSAVPANTFLAHQFVYLAMEYGLQHKAKEALFKAHFTDGLDINDFDTLREIASIIGLEDGIIDHLKLNHKYAEAVKKDEEAAKKNNIKGVPYYLFNASLSVVGAKESSVFLAALEKSYADMKQLSKENESPISDGDVCELGKAC